MVFRTILSLAPITFWARNGVLSTETIIMGIIAIIALLLLEAFLVMIIWNLTLPHMSPAIPCISFGQALGIVLLISILFG